MKGAGVTLLVIFPYFFATTLHIYWDKVVDFVWLVWGSVAGSGCTFWAAVEDITTVMGKGAQIEYFVLFKIKLSIINHILQKVTTEPFQ